MGSVLRALVIAFIPLLGACDRAPTPRPMVPADQVYLVRGAIEALPPSVDSRRISIAHESIPGFVDESGKQVGMPAMTMPFSLAPSVELGELDVGDKLEFQFEVRWKSEPNMLVRKLKKLSDGTPLELAQ